MSETVDSPNPIGTPAELIKAGIDPKKNGCCVTPGNPEGYKPCTYYETCVFARAHADGAVPAFRDNGPKEIGYSIHLGEWGPDRPANEDYMPCHRFMATMWRRMTHGDWIATNEPGKPHDTIRIIALEGELIHRTHQVSKNPGSRTDLGMKAGDPKFRIPKHPRPADLVAPRGEASTIASEREAERAKKEKGARVQA